MLQSPHLQTYRYITYNNHSSVCEYEDPPVSDGVVILIHHGSAPWGGGVGVGALVVSLALVDEGELTPLPTGCEAEGGYPQPYPTQGPVHPLLLGVGQAGQEQQEKS